LFHQFFDIAETLDDEWRLLVIDVDNDRERQGRFEGVFGDERDFAQVFVEVV
jgi:hypothetical protein